MQFSLRWQRGLAAVAIGLTALVLFARHSVDFKPGARLPGDFGVYRRAIERVDSGNTPYLVSDFSPYKYSPGALAPLRVLPSDPNRSWMFMKALYLLGWFFALGVVWSSRERRQTEGFAVRFGVLALGILFSWKGALEALDYGQLDFFLLPLVFGAVLSFTRAPVASGVLLALAPVFKLPWLLLSLPFAIQSVMRKTWLRWASGWMVGAVLGFVIVPTLALPRPLLSLYQDWFTVLKEQPHELYFNDINQSIWVGFARWLGEGALASSAAGVFALMLLGFLILRERKFFERELSECADEWLGMWLLALLLLNPLSWRWAGLFLAVIPFRFRGMRRRGMELGIVIWILAFWLLQQNPVVQALGYKHWSTPHAWGSVTLFWIGILAWLIGSESGMTRNKHQKSQGTVKF